MVRGARPVSDLTWMGEVPQIPETCNEDLCQCAPFVQHAVFMGTDSHENQMQTDGGGGPVTPLVCSLE